MQLLVLLRVNVISLTRCGALRFYKVHVLRRLMH